MLDPISDTIPNFFKGRSVFLTGCTGYVGKLVVEKLLRSCPDVKTVYVLIRGKKSMTVEDRIEKLKSDVLFRILREQNPKALEKIVAIQGDITEVGLGIQDEDKKLLVKNVTVVYHLAASVRFDDFLDTAIITNVRSTRDVIGLASEFDRVDSFVYVGTAYSNCDRKDIDEVFYPSKLDWREAIRMAESPDQKFRETTNTLTQKIIEPMPNTYVFTKGVAEAVVKDLCPGRFPTCIVRPSIVAPTIEDPFPGYVDNFNGPVQLFIASGYGIAKIIHSASDILNDHVYVDNVAKASIIASWQIAKEKPKDIIIYNATSDWCYRAKTSHNLAIKIHRENPVKFYLGPATTSVISCDYGVLKLRRKFVLTNQALLPFLKPDDNKSWIFGNKNYLQLDGVLLKSDREVFSFAHNIQKKGEYELNKTTARNFELFIGKCRCLLIPNEKEQATEAEVTRYKRIELADQIVKKIFWLLVTYVVLIKYNYYHIITNGIMNYLQNL